VFFSATMPRPIQELIKKYARDPQSIRIEQKAMTVPTVEQVYYEVDRRFKIELLTRLIDIHDLKLGIIFCNTKRMVDDLVDHLNAQGYSADRLHGDMSQALRDRVMNKFRKSGLEFLVATDVAARGIDVDDVQVVFNYDLPYDVEDYVHRIGRTGRAGRSGRAISFVSGREVFQIRNIERYTNTRIHRAKIPTPAEVEEARASAFLDKVRLILQGGDFKRNERLVEVLLEEGFSSTDIASALMHLLQDNQSTPSTASKREDQGEDRRNERRGQFDRGESNWDRREPRGSDRREPNGRRERPPRESTQNRGPNPRFVDEQTRAPRADLPNRPARKAHAEVKQAPGPEVQPPSSVELPTPHADRPVPKIPERRPPPRMAEAPKASRRTPKGQTRLHMSVGEEDGVGSADIIRAIQGQTGLPASAIGEVDLRQRHSFVDVASEHANAIVSKLKRSQLGNQRLKVKLAKQPSDKPDGV
jgi:ATP-dependent RNA helicase DeaD